MLARELTSGAIPMKPKASFRHQRDRNDRITEFQPKEVVAEKYLVGKIDVVFAALIDEVFTIFAEETAGLGKIESGEAILKVEFIARFRRHDAALLG